MPGVLGSPEVIGAVIGAVLGALFTGVFFYLRRSKPSRIVVDELVRASLLEVPSEAKDKAAISYGGAKVEQLSLVKLRLRNMGTKLIEKPEIKFVVRDSNKVLDLRAKMSPARLSGQPKPTATPPLRPYEGVFRLDFINAYPEHGEEVFLDLLCDGKISDIDVTGGGREWSVAFIPIEKLKNLINLALLSQFLLIFLGGVFLALGLQTGALVRFLAMFATVALLFVVITYKRGVWLIQTRS